MIRASVIGVEDVIGNLRKLDKQTTVKVRQQMGVSALRVLNDAKTNTPVAFGRLRDSGKVDTKPGEVKVSFGAGSAQWVEFGRRAGKWPPRQPIEDWVKKRGIASGKDIKSRAFLIQRKIGLKGTRKQPFLFPAFDRERARFRSAINKIIK